MTSIFLSHSSKDKFFVRQLAERLKKHGVQVWLDEAELKIGDSLTQKIGQAIDVMDFVGVVLSSNSVNSEWVQKELQVAIQKELVRRRVVVLPILLEQVEIPPFLRDKVYADFSAPEKNEESFNKLLAALDDSSVTASEISGKRVPPNQLEDEETTQLGLEDTELSSAEKQLVDFEDILIIDLDERRSYKPDPNKILYQMYLALSRTPPAEWEQIFGEERRFPRHTMWRKAWIEGQFVVIYCVPEELERYHLADLKQDVQISNKKYRQYLIELAQDQMRELDTEKTEREKIQALKRRLEF